MRQSLGKRKVERMRRETGLDITRVLVRGGTGHRKDVYLADGTWFSTWPDGSKTLPEPARISVQEFILRKGL